MSDGALALSSIGGGVAVARPSRPSLVLPPWLRLEERERGADVVRVGVERGKKAPRQWAEWCLKLGGRNLYGEPNLRIVWSEDETVLVGGVWARWDAHGNRVGDEIGYRRVKKYMAVEERWILEMWTAPETFGTPETWEKEWQRKAPWGEPYQLLPIFPERGDYAQIAVFVDPETGGYSEPSWDDLPGLMAVQAKWKAKDPLERAFELRDQVEAGQAARDLALDEAAAEEAKETRVDVWKDLGLRPRVSLAGLDVPRRTA